MNYSALIKRAFQVTWRYKVLWVFGILLALTSGGGGGGGSNFQFPGRNGTGGMPSVWGMPNIPGETWAAIAIACCCVLLVLLVVGTIMRYVATAALFRMVDQIEAGGDAPTWRQGFRLGWSGRTLRLFLLDLLVGIVFFAVIVVLIALAAAPLLGLLVDDEVVKGLSIAMTVGLALLVILILVVAGVIVSVLLQFWQREIVLADRTVGQALASGFHMVRSRLGNVAAMWLLMCGIGLGYGILFFLVFIPLILLAASVGAGLGYALYWATRSIAWALIAGLPPFLIIMLVPTTFVHGIYMVFQSSTWTLVYRQITGGAGQPAGNG